MPELPDVETFRRYLDSTSLHQEIEDVEVRADRILKDTSAEQLMAGLKGHTFESTRRHGKWLFAQLDDGNSLLLHFGMTGRLKYFKDMAQDPEHDRLLVTFSNEYHLAYDAQRKLGEVGLVDDVEAFVEERGLGPDALAPAFDFAAFQEALTGRRAMVKSALMNQQIVAGIGNVYCDEILFQAGIHPTTRVNDMDDSTLSDLLHAMKHVLRTAVESQADPRRFPASFIVPHREERGTCPRCGAQLRRVKVAGRSAYYCPNRQGE